MTRSMTGAALTETAKPEIRMALLGEFDFEPPPDGAGTMNMWTGVGTLSWDGKSWLGVGDLAGIGVVAEKAGTVASGRTFTLSGVDSALITTALTENYQGREVKTWIAFFDANMALVADPIQDYGGIMDNMDVSDSGDVADIQLRTESYLRRLATSNERRYTDQDQQERFSGDVFFQYVARQLDDGLYWGRDNPHQTRETRKALRKKEKKARKRR